MEYFDPHSNDWLKNKYEIYRELRQQSTAYFSKKYNMYVFTRYDDVHYALSNENIFISGQGNLIVESPHRFGLTLGASDGARHDFFKNIAKNAYSKDNIERITFAFNNYLKELLSASDTLNLSDIVDNLSSLVSTEIIGLPIDKITVKNLIVDIQRHSSRAVSVNIDDNGYDEFVKIIYYHILEKRTLPTQDGIYNECYKFMSDNDFQHQLPLSLFTGPTISGASSLSGGLQFLIVDLYSQGLVKTILNDRSLIPDAINESLRYRASTGRFSRTVTEDINLHGINLKKGDRVALCLDSANRDESRFENPDVFDLTRNAIGHLAFGRGVHACIAMAISKAIMTSYLEIFLDIFGNYEVVTKPDDYKFLMTASGNNDMITNLEIKKL